MPSPPPEAPRASPTPIVTSAINRDLPEPRNKPSVAWIGKEPVAFDGNPEPKETYKSNGVVCLNEDEAAQIKLSFENAFVGRVVGKKFHFP